MDKTIEEASLVAKAYYSGFELAHDTYNAIDTASDGKIYYVLSSESPKTGGQFYSFDPQSETIEHLADLTAACGEKALKAIPQGKSHVEFYESGGKLYFGTHVGYYELIGGMDRLPENMVEGMGLYPGGHFLSWDLEGKYMEDLGKIPSGEGILAMTMDTGRKQIYAISWPHGNLIHLDLNTGKLLSLGKISHSGEAGTPGKDYRVLCRSILLDPDSGKIYFSNAEGDILYYDPEDRKSFYKYEGLDLRRDYFGKYDPASPGSMGYNWRKIFWHEPEKVAYGIHGNSGYLFRFDPKTGQFELLERLCSEPSKKSGMFDQFSYGYLGFKLAPDGETIHYLTGGPVFREGKILKGKGDIAKGAAKGLENLHWVTYHIPTRLYTDHGPVMYEDGGIPTYVNSIAIDRNNKVYTLARIQKESGVIQDLIRIN